MGMMLLDVEFRAERALGVQIPRNWLEQLGIQIGGGDATLQDFHDYLIHLSREQNVKLPSDSWSRLVASISEATGAQADQLGPDTQLIRDIAPFG